MTDCVTMTMTGSPMDRTRIGPNPRMGRETNSRKVMEAKAETETETGMETEIRIQETDSVTKTNSVGETAGAISLSDRTDQDRAAVFVI